MAENVLFFVAVAQISYCGQRCQSTLSLFNTRGVTLYWPILEVNSIDNNRRALLFLFSVKNLYLFTYLLPGFICYLCFQWPELIDVIFRWAVNSSCVASVHLHTETCTSPAHTNRLTKLYWRTRYVMPWYEDIIRAMQGRQQPSRPECSTPTYFPALKQPGRGSLQLPPSHYMRFNMAFSFPMMFN